MSAAEVVRWLVGQWWFWAGIVAGVASAFDRAK